jgi:SAM-dependent methyltransferase
MESSLARVPEPAVMAPDEEMEYIKCNSGVFRDTHPLVRAFADLCPGFPNGRAVRILDVGCGLANMSIELAKAYPEASVVAVDASAPMLRHARILVDHFKFGDRVSVRQALLPDADFGEPERSFDLVFGRSILHHFADPAGFWRTVNKYSRDGAALYVVDLLRPSSWPIMERLVWERFGARLGPLRSAFQASLLASHTIGEIEAQLEEAGLRDAVAVPFPEQTHVTVWRPGLFGGKHTQRPDRAEMLEKSVNITA